MSKGQLAKSRQCGPQTVATIDGFTSRKRFDRVALKGAVAGESRLAPADLGRVGIEYQAVSQ